MSKNVTVPQFHVNRLHQYKLNQICQLYSHTHLLKFSRVSTEGHTPYISATCQHGYVQFIRMEFGTVSCMLSTKLNETVVVYKSSRTPVTCTSLDTIKETSIFAVGVKSWAE